jgi:hypothetical protein
MNLSDGGQHACGSGSAPTLAAPFHAPLYNVLGAAFHGATADGKPVLAEKCHPPRFQSLSVSTTFEVCIKTLEVASSRRQSVIHPELGPTAGGV